MKDGLSLIRLVSWENEKNNRNVALRHELIPKGIYFLYRLIPICIVIDKKYTYQQSCRHFCKVLKFIRKVVDRGLSS